MGHTAAFADVLVGITGIPAVRILFLITAFVGAVGVMNSTLYSSARMLYGLSCFALVSRKFSRPSSQIRHPGALRVFYRRVRGAYALYGEALFPALHQRGLSDHHRHVGHVFCRGAPAAEDPARPGAAVRMPGGRLTAAFGTIASVFLAGNILLPMSPGALGGLEYLLSALLAALGMVLYRLRDRSLSGAEREALIFGGRLSRTKGETQDETDGTAV